MRAEVVIAGGGPVGATLALALREAGLDVVLAEPRPRPDATLRPVALSHGSRLILERLGAFGGFPTTAIEAIHVSQAGSFGRTVMRREEHGVEALGYVCNLPDLAAVLADAAASVRCEARVAAWAQRGDAIAVTLEDAAGTREIDARLLVLADGARSVGADLAMRDYGQSAIVALVRPERMPRGLAWERFTDEGPIALLPCADRYALIWTVRADRAEALAAADDQVFLAELGRRFGARLGRFVEVGVRAAYPLSLRYRQDPVAAPRVVAIGNAAQTLHPVAGQGLNLGLRDAFELAMLARATPAFELGSEGFLARMRARRAADRRASIAVTDALARVFASSFPGLAAARGLGLAALDAAPPARRFLARRMMLGVRGLP